VVTSAVCLLVYVAVQQDLRGTANDPQIQMAEDAAAELQAGRSPASVAGTGIVDIGQSLAPYLIIYDDKGQVLASTATLGGQVPEIAPGVLSNVRQSGEERVTWQPQKGVRSAAVVTRVLGSSPGFVLAGRSLLEVEMREAQLGSEVLLAWVAAMVGGLVAMFVSLWLRDHLAPRPTASL
jgi:hypothetical protein